MRDVNIPLRKLYYSLLSEIGYPVYYMEQPDNKDDEVYIVFHNPNSSDASTFNTHDTSTSMQVSVHVKAIKGDSLLVDQVAAQVYEKLIPSYNEHIQGDDIQIVSTRVTADRTEEPLRLGGVIFGTRSIIFSHGIFIRNFITS